MISKCYNCEFFVKPDEKFCPDCGVSDPNQPLTFNSGGYDRPLSVKTIVFIAAVILITLTLINFFKDNDNYNEAHKWIALSLLPVILIFLFVAPAILHFLGKKERRKRQSQSQSPTNFRFIEDEIAMREHEMEEKLYKLRKTAKRGKRQSNRATESNASQERTEIQNLRARYDSLYDKIQFARLQNYLLSIIEQRKDLKIEADFLEEVDEILSEIKEIKSSLTHEQAAEFFEPRPGDERELLLQMTETEKLCADVLKSKSDVGTYRNNFETSPLKNLAYQANNFDVQVTLRNVVASFNESERTYQRLKIQRQ